MVSGSEGDFTSPYGPSDTIVPAQPTTNLLADFDYPPFQSAGPTLGQGLPWETAPSVASPSVFWPSIDIDGRRWDQLYPYRLLVIDVTKQNAIVNGSTPPTIVVRKGTDTAVLEVNNYGNHWIFGLPITPQQLNIQDIFAINTAATLRGVIEEHNGVKFKMISASGTMGVWPSRGSVSSPPSSPSVLQSVFGGTLEAFGNLASKVQSIANVATGNSAASKPKTPRPESGGVSAGLITTGYYNAVKLQQFLEQYAEAKKNPANAGWRLVFDVPKQNQSFIVTPTQYVWQQSQAKAMEILYSFQLKAWRRIDLNQRPSVVPTGVSTLTPGILQRILNTLFTAREACSAALSLIGAVRSDIEAPLAALQQTTMLVKDLAGVALTAADLPTQLKTDYKNAIATAMNNLTINNLTGDAATDAPTISALQALQSSLASNEGLSLDAVNSGQLGFIATQYQSSDPAQNIFTNPEQYFLLYDQVPLNSLQLTTDQQTAVSNAISAANSITVSGLKQFRATIQTLALQLSNNFGSGNAFFSKVYNLPPPTTQIAPITLDDYQLLDTLYDVMQSYDLLTASTQIDTNNQQTSMEYVAGLAQQSDITFNTDTSMILVPVPFGLTMEGIAARYLNDPQRWLEIATLNNLREPYIDENGFQIALLSNASGRNITVGDASHLYLGQTVTLQGANQLPTSRKILGIDTLSATSYLLTLDGLPNLENFTTADSSYIQVYLPGTVNSQQKIFVPTTIPVTDTPTITIPAVASADPLSGLSLVDLLLTDTGDVAINNYGDFRYSYGLTNIVQALKIKFSSIAGTILLHPEFGLTVRAGTITSDVQVQEVFNQVNNMILADSRFAGISTLQVLLNGTTFTINIGVVLAANNGVFPISFELTS